MVESIKNRLPEFAKDARINVGKVLDLSQTDGLSQEQIVGAALAVAYHLGDQPLVESIQSLQTDFNIEEAAKNAASLMAMNNIYYRFVHLSELPELGRLPAGLRMQGMMNPGTDKVTFEILSLAVSILNGCGVCISSHSRQLLEHGLNETAIARVGRISAVIHAVHVSSKIN